MTKSKAYKLIGERAAELSKNTELITKLQARHNGDIEAIKADIYMCAIATLYGQPESLQRGENQRGVA